MLKNKRILISGMGGTIGGELARQLSKRNKIFGIDINETSLYRTQEELRAEGRWVHTRTGDIRDPDVVADCYEDFKPQIIFHAAALKNVSPSEVYPIEAIKTNILGTYNMMAEAKRWECLEKFVFISTDKVVNASCIMGITKLCAEGIIRRAGEKFVAVRFGNVIGSSGSVCEIWGKQVENGEDITITDARMERFMMTIFEACELVIEAAEKGGNGETWILDMGKPKNIFEFKNELYGKEYPIKIIGIRPGEQLSEKLMTKDEESIAIKQGRFFILK